MLPRLTTPPPSESGQTMAEYVVMLVPIIAMLGVMTGVFGPAFVGLLTRVAAALTG
jgi:Flp pilus assembly pilin Flp